MKLTSSAEQLHDKARQSRAATVRRTLDRTKPQVVGAAQAAQLLDKRELVHRGRAYRVPIVPFEDGAVAMGLADSLEAIRVEGNPEMLRAWAAKEHELAKRCVRPLALRDRLRWSNPDYNPFRGSTLQEAATRLGFFCALHLLDEGVTMEEMEQALKKPRPGTSSTSTPPSSPASPRSAGPSRGRMSKPVERAIRSRGRTS